MDEPLDRNKSILTHKLTALAILHLKNIGCKPVETEVPYKEFIADVAGFTYPTMTELKRGKLLRSAIIENPLLKNEMDWTVTEFIHRRVLFPLTAIVEVKISLADFKKDFDTKFSRHHANLNYIMIPNEIKDSIIEFVNSKRGLYFFYNWTLLIASNNGERLIKSEIPHIQPVFNSDITDLIASIAIRRCHRTEYAFLRMALKQRRADK